MAKRRDAMAFTEDVYPVRYGDAAYPEALKNIYDPPSVLYCKGSLLEGDADAVAVVGARLCSFYGMQMAEKLAFGLAKRGVTVVSGMARGIDTAAHRGALKAGGRTIAVMGSGFDHIYPPGSEELARKIAANGAVITEYSADIHPSRATFPRRNRIISGLAKGVVVVEAARRSGAMITVNLALEQGKEVFAVPGRADARASAGTNLLIQEGAKLVLDVDDILEELDIPAREGRASGRPSARADEAELSGRERDVADLLRGKGAMHVDVISGMAGIGPADLPEALLRLELAGVAKALPGGRYIIEGREVHAD